MSVSRRRSNHLRLVPVAGGAWAASLVATTFPAAAALVALPLWVLTLCVLVAVALMRGSRRRAVILLLTLAAAAAAASHVAVAQPARTEAERFALSGGRSVVVEATVVGKVELRATGEWAFDAVATRLVTGAVSDSVRFDVAVRVQPSDVDHADRARRRRGGGAVGHGAGGPRRRPRGAHRQCFAGAARAARATRVPWPSPPICAADWSARPPAFPHPVPV